MPLTRSFAETVQNRARRDPAFKAALFEEALQALFDGESAVARDLLRDCINATVGFHTVSEKTGIPTKSLMRMVGPNGNPQLNHVVAILSSLQRENNLAANVNVVYETAYQIQVVDAASSGNVSCIDGPKQVYECV